MKMIKPSLLLGGVGLFLFINLADAAQTFVIDTNQSVLTLSGNVIGMTVKEQGLGSMTSTMEGNIMVEVGATSIKFPGGGVGVIRTNGSWAPGVGGVAGTAPANFAGQASSFLGSAKGALRNARFDVISESLPLSQSTFPATGLMFSFLTNTPAPAFDYSMLSVLGNTSGTVNMTGMATNKVVATASLVANGNSLVLTIPFDASFPLNVMSTGDSLLTIKGQLVAVSQSQPAADLVIGPITIGAQGISMQWTSEPNQVFQVLGCTDLSTWIDVSGDIFSTTSSYSWTSPMSAQVGFFMLKKK